MAVDSSGNIYALENTRIIKFDNAGNLLGSVGTQGSGNNQLFHAEDIRIGPDGRIYVLDKGNNRVVAYLPNLAQDSAMNDIMTFETAGTALNAVGLVMITPTSYLVSDSSLNRVIKIVDAYAAYQ